MARRRKTTEQFIKEAKEIHGDKYDYFKTEYISARKKVIIICKKHGEFEQTPDNHLHGAGCLKCGNKRTSNSQRLNNEKFINKAIKKHGCKFNYSETKYVDSKTKVIIICKKHGKFKQSPNRHLRGDGCPRCSKNKKLTTIEFIDRSIIIHENNYNYSKTKYVSARKKVIIICKKHGEFKQTPYSHLSGSGCPKCKLSKGEKRVEKYLKSNNISFKNQKRFKDCKYRSLLPFDFYLPDYNICIEFDGEQHFKAVKYWNGKKGLKEQQIKDKIKTKYCEDNGIKLIRIPYTEFNNIEEILKTKI